MQLYQHDLIFMKQYINAVQIVFYLIYIILFLHRRGGSTESRHIDTQLCTGISEKLFQFCTLLRMKEYAVAGIAFMKNGPLIELFQIICSGHFFFHIKIREYKIIRLKKIPHYVSGIIPFFRIVLSHSLQRCSVPYIQIGLTVFFYVAAGESSIIDQPSGFCQMIVIGGFSGVNKFIY